MKVLSLAILNLLLLASVVFAAPGIISQKLINDKASMLDLGIARMEMSISNYLLMVDDFFVKQSLRSVEYDYENDLIVINMSIARSELDYSEEVLLKSLGIYSDLIQSLIKTEHFMHSGFEYSEISPTRGEIEMFLDNRVKIIYWLGTNGTDKIAESVCENGKFVNLLIRTF